jgi:hypothetical protein
VLKVRLASARLLEEKILEAKDIVVISMLLSISEGARGRERIEVEVFSYVT